MKQFILAPLALAALVLPLSAQNQRRAEINGDGNPNRGKCTVEVYVDDAAEVQVRGNTATVRNLQGQGAQLRRFQCTSTMPANPGNFRFEGVDGRGRQQLVQDPRNGGAAVIQITDPDGGSEGYTFDLIWDNTQGGGFFDDGSRLGRQNGRGFDGRPGPGGAFGSEQAIRLCQDAIRQEAAQRFGPVRISFRDTNIDNNPGRSDWILGLVSVDRSRWRRAEVYRFSCSVDLRNGTLRTAHIGVPNF